jgi:nucleoside-diphosphate-sugar epimerase
MEIQLAGEDGISLNPVFVGDVAEFLHLQLQDNSSHVYNVAGPDVHSIRSLVTLIENSFGGTAKFIKIPPGENIVADSSDFLERLDFSPTSVEEGFKSFHL